MATPLNIKQGLKKDLPGTRTSGTLYFCTDTEEILMDTSSSERITITNQTLADDIENLQTNTVTSIKIEGSDNELKVNNSVIIPRATTSKAGTVKLSSNTNFNDETVAATAKAVRTTYSLANTAQTTAEAAQTAVANITPITLKNYELGSQGEGWIRNENDTDSDIVDTSIYNVYIDIPITGVTADMIPEVIFDTNVALSGKFAPIAKTIEGFVRLYSSSVYVSLIIPIITCRAQGTVIEVTA